MDAKKYLDFAFEAAVDTIDVGAFKKEDALAIIVTGMKAFVKRNGYDFTDEQIQERAAQGIRELDVANADFDPKHRDDSVNAPRETSREDLLGYAFDSVTAVLDLGGFKHEDAVKMVVTGMKAYSDENSLGFTSEEIHETADKKLRELAVAEADFDSKHRADSVNAPKETTREEMLGYAFDSVTAVLDLGGFKPEDAFKFAVTGMKAYAYDNNQDFTAQEIRDFAAKKIKELDKAAKDFEYQTWSMPR